MLRSKNWVGIGLLWVVAVGLAACRPSPDPIVITATFPPPPEATTIPTAPPPPTIEFIQPSPNPTRPQNITETASSYTIQPGDTLTGIALANGVALEVLAELNNITNPNLLSVGQVLQLPAPPSEFTPSAKLMSNTRFVRGPASIAFDVPEFIATQPGYIRTATDTVPRSLATGFRIEEELTAAQVIERVSREFSVDPRLLLALLEYESGWLSRSNMPEPRQRFPLGEANENREGLYNQLAWAANQLNQAYYGWRYDDLAILQLSSGERRLYDPSLNGATVAIQYYISLKRPYSAWLRAVTNRDFLNVYGRYFGDPFVDDGVLVPDNLTQPEMDLPFAQEETWFYTGGPHGGWGNGSAWAAVDLAPPDDRAPTDAACYTSEYPVRAVAPGVIARSGGGSVVLDLDSDGNEETGWTILYLHISEAGSAQNGQIISAGDVIGYASCAGGFSNATHLHIARRYNGEWLPADCHSCPPGRVVPPFTMGGWRVYGIPNQVYQGTMVRSGITMRAEQGRLVTFNRISWLP